MKLCRSAQLTLRNCQCQVGENMWFCVYGFEGESSRRHGRVPTLISPTLAIIGRPDEPRSHDAARGGA